MTAVPDDQDMLAASLDAYDAGLCVVRAATDGTKKPVGYWQRWQQQRPTREQVIAWFSAGHAGMGAICGAVSGGLEMFELEGRVGPDGREEFARRMKQAGHEFLWRKLLDGLVVTSPSDGRHFVYRVDGPVDGNTKLARNADSETLIETRGEGGFVVLPPSHGTVHPSGKPWRRSRGAFGSIVTLTVDEREALFAVARSFDEAPAPKPVQPVAASERAQMRPWQRGTVGDSWYDAVVDHLEQTWTMRSLLEHYGWTHVYDDRHGRQLLRRPGKDEGVSGSVNGNGRFHPFSSSTPFPSASADKGSPTYDLLDVIATYEHQGDRDAAAREIAEHTGILTAWARARDEALMESLGVRPTSTGDIEAVPPGIDPATGEIVTSNRLDDAFFAQRPVLQHIHQAARSRLVAPAALLGCVLARIAAWTPPSVCLPPLIGGVVPLSIYIGLHGNSGAGKSAPTSTAGDLLPGPPPGRLGPLALGSGEGLVEAFFEMVEDGKRKVKQRTKFGVLFSLDEGQALAELGSRRGSTILPVLRTAWSGGDPGQANASIETRRSLRPASYAVGLVSLWQDKAAALLLADADGGTPQRFVWLPTTDPDVTLDNRPAWPGPIAWTPPPAIKIGDILQHTPMTVSPAIEAEIEAKRVEVLAGRLIEPPLDAHRRLNKLKVAGCLALLDGRRNIDDDDWRIAETIITVSDTIRAWVLAEARRSVAEATHVEASRAVYREALSEKSSTERALARAAKQVWRVAEKAAGAPIGRRDISRSIASRDRQIVSVDDAINEAERLRWVVQRPDGWVVGEARPT
jgi:hypothetical protein